MNPHSTFQSMCSIIDTSPRTARTRQLGRIRRIRRGRAFAGLIIALAAGEAGAYSPCRAPDPCSSRIGPLAAETPKIPVDGVPWISRPCCDDAIEPGACVLVHGSDAVAVTVEEVGEEPCAGASVQRFAPQGPLMPDTRYQLVCDGVDLERSVRTRASTAPAAPPAGVTVTEVRYRRGDDAFCGRGDFIELHVGEVDPTSFKEGGYLEVAYASGEVFPWTEAAHGTAELPATRDAIEVTAVAADGARGETIRIEADEIEVDAVYLRCDVGGGNSARALWVLAPMAWLQVRRRRRVR